MTFIKIHRTFCLLLVNLRTHLLRKTCYSISKPCIAVLDGFPKQRYYLT